MWESRRDFQGVWEGWEAGIMAFHAFHTLSFPWPAFRPAMLNKPLRHPAQCAEAATNPVSMRFECVCESKKYPSEAGIASSIRVGGFTESSMRKKDSLKGLWVYGMFMLFCMQVRAQENTPAGGGSQGQFVTVEPGVKLEVLDWGGKGRAVVLLAGLGNDAHVFDTFASKLTEKYHVYGVTRRGYGASDTPPAEGENYSADRLGDDVIAVLDELKLERPVLAGHSIAGEELSSIGSRYPQRVAGLVYLDAGYQYALYDASRGDYWIDTNELRRQFNALNKLLGVASASKTVNEIVQELPNYEKELLAHQKELASYLPLTPEQTKDEAARMTNRSAISASAVLHGEQRYTAISCPILAIFSEPHAFSPGPAITAQQKADAEAADIARIEPQAKAFEALGANVRVVRIPHADHYVFRSNESDVLREMSAFIATLP